MLACHPEGMCTIRHARFPDDAAAVLDIWREYIASPSVSLEYQGNAAEFADLPGKYAAPAGRVLLAESAGAILGCIAMRPVSAAICEMKRLYVRPAARGTGLGRRLAERLIAEARAAGYAEMRLDVLAEFDRARHLYARLGFAPAAAVAFNPVPGTAFLGLALL
jgi:GNAT superfamily N-acetyltransferase